MKTTIHAITEDIIDRRIPPGETEYLAELRTPPKRIRVNLSLMKAVHVDDTL